jgi:hypothetical protein
LPNLELLTKDGGAGMAKGLEIVRAERQAQGQAAATAATPPGGGGTAVAGGEAAERTPVPGPQILPEQDDHFHVVREGHRALRRQQGAVTRAMEKADRAQKALERQARQGQNQAGHATQAKRLWQQAEQLLDRWGIAEVAWQRIQGALGLFTPAGDLNVRAQAEAVIAANLPALHGPCWAKVRRLLQRPTLFTYLDQVHQRLAALPVEPGVRDALVGSEGLRRRPELLQGAGARPAACRGLLLVTAVLLHQLGTAGQQAAEAVQAILGQAWRASSAVEGLNSVVRMQQARHRKLTQGMLDLKRLYWNCHSFRTGRRKGQTPYARLGLILPRKKWWELLKLTPEQLRQELSTQGVAA